MLLSTGRFYNRVSGGGGPPPAGILDGLSPTGAWSLSRNLLSSFGGSRYTDVSGAVSSLNDQSGNSRNLTQATSGARPAITTAGPNNRACADFDGTNDVLSTAVGDPLSDFISASAGWMYAVVIIDAVSLNVAPPTAYNNHQVIGDRGEYFSISARALSRVTFYANNYDGTGDSAAGSGVTGTIYVLSMRHGSGTVYLSINGGSETSAASGNTLVLTHSLNFGGIEGLGQHTNMKLFESALFSSVPSSGQRSAVIADAMTFYGAS